MAHGPRTPDTYFWVEPSACDGNRLRLSAEESRHLIRVFRAAPGALFEATDGRGSLFRCVLESTEGETAIGRIESKTDGVGELPFPIHLLIGLPNVTQMETIIEHAVPLGATTIDFVVTARSGPERLSKARLDRLGRIARSAVKQSRRTRLPGLRSSRDLDSAVQSLSPDSWRLVAHPKGENLLNLHQASPQANVAIAVGPPGGFLDEEAERLQTAKFFPISLGPSRLTTSTALLCLLAMTRNSLLSSGFR